MDAKNIRWLGWLIAGFNIAIMGIGLVLQVVTKSPLGGAPFLVHFGEVAGLCGFAIVGALILSRHPRHPIGWIWLLVAFSFGVDHFAWGYAYYGSIAHPGSLPGTGAAIVWLYWLGRGTLGLLGITLLLLLFPNGRLLSRHWAIVAWIAIARVVVTFPVHAFAPDPIIYFPFPTDILAASDRVQVFLGPIRLILAFVGLLSVVAAMFSLFLRLISTRGVERQQIKWFVYTASLLPPTFILIFFAGSRDPQNQGFNWLFLLATILALIASISMAASNLIAIFRYRLWEIDLIIHRTLIYSTLTAALALVYLSSVLLLQFLFETIIGQRPSELVTVVSTLTSAALFVPIRHRVQYFIDRKFYRRKYDAEQVLENFGKSVRNEVDLDHLMQSILEVVEETMHPVHVSFWLLGSPDTSGIRKKNK